jgi:1,5-anhydro-D-fructose reductase (1,5-anhydro-D-mannitol-forming)
MARSPLAAPIRWGIIGCGNVTEVKSGPAFQQVPGSALVAVMRRSGELAADYARRHGVSRSYDDADALVRDAEVDAVYIATPPGSHLEHALRACRAGKPAYVEKPMARNHAECREMVRAFQEAGLPLYVAYYRRGMPRFLRVKEIVASGILGKITSVSLRLSDGAQRGVDPSALPWRLVARESGGGLFLDVGSHGLDIVDFILGPLDDVNGLAARRASSYEVEDVVSLSYQAGGVPGTGLWDFASSRREDSLEINGTRARLLVSVFGQEPIRLLRADAVEEIAAPYPAHVQAPLVQTIVDELLGRGECASTGESAARTSRVIDLALSGYYGGREDAFWERPERWPGRRG